MFLLPSRSHKGNERVPLRDLWGLGFRGLGFRGLGFREQKVLNL